MSKPTSFSDIFEELTWEMFKIDGNPYIIEELVKERNAKREKESKQEELCK